MNASVHAGCTLGMGCGANCATQLMLILTHIQALVSSAAMGSMEAELH